jgi:hypothetical protein
MYRPEELRDGPCLPRPSCNPGGTTTPIWSSPAGGSTRLTVPKSTPEWLIWAPSATPALSESRARIRQGGGGTAYQEQVRAIEERSTRIGELGIIGFSQPMPVFPFTAFSVRDDDLIVIERLTGQQYLRAEERPEEVASFLKFFDLLREAASTGTEAEAIIERALESLR